jgi:hypothetical protein
MNVHKGHLTIALRDLLRCYAWEGSNRCFPLLDHLANRSCRLRLAMFTLLVIDAAKQSGKRFSDVD